jgi:tetratricopeptide (TPR) repeat protein
MRQVPKSSTTSHLGTTRTSGGSSNVVISRKAPATALVATIVVATLVAYSPALRGGLLWDDASHVTQPALQSWHGLWRIWTHVGATQQYYPLLHSAFWIEHRLWGDTTLGYHLVNVALHAASACLVFLIARRLALPGAWLAGLIFALHPVCVEAVAWISEQKSTLSAFFYLSAALAYLNFDRTRRRPLYLLALALFVLALLTKTVTATLPAALLVTFWWQRGRIEWRRDVQPLLPWFAIGATAGLLTAWVEKNYIGANGADFTLTPTQHILLAGRGICFYAAKLVWPAGLVFTYPRWQIDPAVWWQWLFPAAVLGVAVPLYLLARRYRGPLAALLLFAGTLFPVLGFLNIYPFVFSYVADHFQYLASLAIIVPVASLLASWLNQTVLAAVLVPVLGVLTFAQAGIYRDSETLYRAILARNPASWMAHNNLGVALAAKPDRLQDAISEYQAALRFNPLDAQAYNNLGNALARNPARLREAIADFQAALRINPFFPEAHVDLGMAMARMPGGIREAIAEYQTALRLKPDDPQMHNDLGVALAQIPGHLQDATSEFEAALRIDPNNAEAHDNLGNAFSQSGRLPEATAEFRAALRLRPGDAHTHSNLGIALAQTGRLQEAVAEFQAALRISPDYAEAHNNLGRTLSQIPGRLPDAIAEFQAALRINPNYMQASANLGAARSQTTR